MKLDKAGVSAALGSGASANDASPVSGETPLLFIAKQGHYKYPPADIPALLIGAGADLEAKNADGRTALEVGGRVGGRAGGLRAAPAVVCGAARAHEDQAHAQLAAQQARRAGRPQPGSPACLAGWVLARRCRCSAAGRTSPSC
jgi:hypothetical protein